ncbi:pancreatic lipase-related protein 2-like [Stegodyphus dumicola]|uniref:pancreatic lipase-related protein 2-like n=1 Tax=Stegodyphus dumicola TaxID=202533 RepID=UPI0015ADC5E2|nr:pancreatic lipase-related protein 2-like [Stegodyphus dumicola]
MNRNILYFIFLILLTASIFSTSAYDIFEGLFKQGASCFEPSDMEGCNATLVDSFTPTHKGLGTNKPTTEIVLFTEDNPEKPEFLHLCGGKLPSNSKFNPEANTEIFVHGWLDGVCRTAWMREMKEQLLQRGNYNVILFDWTWGNTPDYAVAASHTKTVGQQMAFVIKNIMQQKKVSAETFHIIGHSFGSHIAGFAGKQIKNLRRITALDPALAPFKGVPPEERLDYKDAKIVDVIHSNAGECFIEALGAAEQLGHADFYPNGGTVQKSCIPYIFISFLKGDFLYALVSLSPTLCNHVQSIQYYKVSINASPCQFIGLEAKTYEQFKSEDVTHRC